MCGGKPCASGLRARCAGAADSSHIDGLSAGGAVCGHSMKCRQRGCGHAVRGGLHVKRQAAPSGIQDCESCR
jgi:hypothetical protein